jgi:alkylhydroperoxidase family enzyme
MRSVDLTLLALPAVAAATRAETFCSMCLQHHAQHHRQAGGFSNGNNYTVTHAS